MTESIIPLQHEVFFDGDLRSLTISQPSGPEFETANEIELNGQHNVEAFIKALCEKTDFYPVNPKLRPQFNNYANLQNQGLVKL